jgi:hypothetical protein
MFTQAPKRNVRDQGIKHVKPINYKCFDLIFLTTQLSEHEIFYSLTKNRREDRGIQSLAKTRERLFWNFHLFLYIHCPVHSLEGGGDQGSEKVTLPADLPFCRLNTVTCMTEIIN